MVQTKPQLVGGLVLCNLFLVLEVRESVGLGLVLLLGLVDDVRDLSPLTKLTVETLIAWVVTSSVPAVVWIVFFMNAMNLSDNMDGLATGLGLIASLGLGMWELALVLSLVLPFNLKPARVYLGDLGSLSLGYLLALAVIKNPHGVVFVFVPIVDTVYVSASRLIRGRSPFRGGRDHLSHVIERKWGTWAAVGALWSVGVVLAIIGKVLGLPL